jgi:nitrogen regulatory protein PII
MKAVLIVHNTALDRDVGELLDSVGVRSYTKFPNILGRGELSEPHLNIEVWPETNCGTFIVTEESKAKEIMELVRRMRKTLGSEGIKAFVWEIIDVT